MSQPNILLIHTDQHRYDCLGSYGNTDIKTPNIDSLASDGVLFQNSFCPFPVCTPSRYSLLSGQYVHLHRGFANVSTLDPGIPTLPRIFRKNGYHTTAVGKMHFTPTYLDVGFDEMYLSEQCGNGRYDDDYHRWLREEGLCDRIDLVDQMPEFRKTATEDYWNTFGAERSDLDEEHYSTTWIAERALEVLANWEEGGNFLMVGFIKPHHPFDPPSPWDTMYDPNKLEILPGWTNELIHDDNGKGYFSYEGLSEQSLRRVMALYYATISQIDHHVGRMIDMLKKKGLYDDAIIVFTSDHGDYMGYHHRILKGYRMLEPLVRVPLIIKYSSESTLKGKDARLVSNIDVAPTLLGAAGLERSETMPGVDLMNQNVDPEYVFAESGNEYMIRTKNHKLLLQRDENKSMFFDLEDDPFEMTNLFRKKERQHEISVLREKLARFPAIDERPGNHLDRSAPLCRAVNARNGDTGLHDYFKSVVGGDAPGAL